MTSETKIGELTARLGHTFANPALLHDALTHPSLTGRRQRKKSKSSPYERLEFLGDRVLGLVVAEWLYELFPEADEGEMAKRHASLVNRDALRIVALEIGLNQHLRLAHSEDVTSKHKNIATLSDAMEAVIGAIYLDAGLEPARRFIQRYWREATDTKTAPADPKTALQEWAQGQGLPLPVYKVVERLGPAHAPKFVIEASVKGIDPVRAEGQSKRLAEKAAARELLEVVAEIVKKGT
jgi:ribonuclease-3